MYKKEMLVIGDTYDSAHNYEDGYYIYLPHSCDAWVIGGIEEALLLIEDLQDAIKEMEIKR